MAQPDISITVQSTSGTHTFTVPQTTTVEELAAEAAAHFGLLAGPNISLFYNGEELQGNRPLVSFHLPENAVLVLTDTSGGV